MRDSGRRGRGQQDACRPRVEETAEVARYWLSPGRRRGRRGSAMRLVAVKAREDSRESVVELNESIFVEQSPSGPNPLPRPIGHG